MGSLFMSPLDIRGTLTQVRLFNFSLPPSDVAQLVPQPLRPVVLYDRVWVSMVSVQLKNMRPACLPIKHGVGYHHIAYRLLVDCPTPDGPQRGVFFLKSFSDKLGFVALGNLMTEYKFTHAEIDLSLTDHGLALACRDQESEILATFTDEPRALASGSGLKNIDEGIQLVGPLKQAFSVHGSGRTFVVKISRLQWPLAPIHCCHFNTTHFPNARLELALRVTTPVPYLWHKAQRVTDDQTPPHALNQTANEPTG